MKKSWIAVVLSLTLVLAMSYTFSNLVLPLLKERNTSSQRNYTLTNCLTDSLDKNDDIYSIAKAYRDGGATVAVEVGGYNTTSSQHLTSRGSGVCVASKGYQTALSNGYTASKGSYFVTNYHVIDFYDSDEFTNLSLKIKTEDEKEYDCTLLWFNQDLDIALIYSNDVNVNYVKMKDRSIFCDQSEKLDYEPIFTIGTPLEIDYLNRLTVGNVASNNPMCFYTTSELYSYRDGKFKFYPSSIAIYSNTVLSNLYEDVVDISLGISPGNSGGGAFDGKGYLVGLTTLGGNVNQTGGNQMNGMVPIYPLTRVLDKLIDNNENGGKNKIVTLESLFIKGFDAVEANTAKGYLVDGNYYFDKALYAQDAYESQFSFDKYGYYILSNAKNKLNVPGNSYITQCEIAGKTYEIDDRNDLIYSLLLLDGGMSISLTYTTQAGEQKSVTTTL